MKEENVQEVAPVWFMINHENRDKITIRNYISVTRCLVFSLSVWYDILSFTKGYWGRITRKVLVEIFKMPKTYPYCLGSYLLIKILQKFSCARMELVVILFTENFVIYNFSTDLFHFAAPPWNPRVPSGPRGSRMVDSCLMR